MGNTVSDNGEQEAYNVIRWIPGIGQIYSAGRAIAYAAKGDGQEVINSAIGSLGVAGMIVNGVRLSDAFDKQDEYSTQWKGDDQQYKQIPGNYFDNHLFDVKEFAYLFDTAISQETLDAFGVSAGDVKYIYGDCTNIPALRLGSSQFTYSDAITTDIMLTSYAVAYDNGKHQGVMSVTTFKFSRMNIFDWTQLDATKREAIEAILSKYKDSARSVNRKQLEQYL